jgi:hypothetical protein
MNGIFKARSSFKMLFLFVCVVAIFKVFDCGGDCANRTTIVKCIKQKE